MNISYNWLKDYLDFNLTPDEVSAILTGTGLEVEAVVKFESVKGGLEGLKIGTVKSVEKHPDADKLSITMVSIGDEKDLQIVCGAPNVAAGQQVIVATDGSIIHPFSGEPFRIKKAKIRGVVSEGMICAEDEIGISDNHGGIMVLPDSAKTGSWAKDFLEVHTDYILEIGLTPNRGDAMSHIGTARDLAAYLQATTAAQASLKIPSVENFKEGGNTGEIEVTVEDAVACPRYSGITISGLKVQDSPEWLKAKLKSVGFRPINNIVDIANFVMLECGQPLHAFDADKIHDKKIIVKCLPEGSLFRTLDDKEIKLHQNDLMICDSQGGMCIAGVYGGLHSGVKETTTNIFLESACFHPKYIRRTSTAHGLRTDAAMHFEKGTDPANTIYALKRAASLIMEICGGKASSGIVDIYPEPVKDKIISLTWEKLNRITGINIPWQTALKILQALSFKLMSTTEEGITVSAPSFKTDVSQSEDVIEEILRIYGYDHIEIPAAVRSSLTLGWENKKELLYEELSHLLAATGFREMMNNSISNSNYHETFFGESSDSIVRLLSYSNAGLDSLRTSLLFPALEVVRYNLNRKQSSLKLFEFGKGYRKTNGGYQESAHLILIVSGHLTEESWKEKQEDADIYYVKGIIANVLKKVGIAEYTEDVISNETWRNAMVYKAGMKPVVTFGRINEKILAAFDIKKDLYYAEFDADLLVKEANHTISFSAPPRFPAVRRDLAIVLDKKITFKEIEEAAYKAAGNLLKEVHLFDVYEDEKLGEGKKSYATGFLFQDENKTLTDEEVEKLVGKIINQFKSKLEASIRN